jgi:hypothetical protein
MGWTAKSPPYFCAATETVTDVANDRAHTNWSPPPHRLDEAADSKPANKEPTLNSSGAKAITFTDLSDIIPNRQFRKRLLSRFDVSMGQGNPEASPGPRLLGNSQGHPRLDNPHLENEIELPQHRIERLAEMLESIPRTQKRVAIQKWQQVLGELQSMSIAIPGSRGLFSLLHEDPRHQEPGARIRLLKGVHDCLDDFRWIANDLASRPTRLYEIVPQTHPELLGAQDACGFGMGGVWFPASPQLQR